jgi:hypothetical protein
VPRAVALVTPVQAKKNPHGAGFPSASFFYDIAAMWHRASFCFLSISSAMFPFVNMCCGWIIFNHFS